MAIERDESVWIGGRRRHDGPIRLAEYDPDWPAWFEHEARRIRAALGDTVVLLEHAGSTSVPGLSGKPVIDIVLAVPDSTDEAAYVPQLEAAGYRLTIREPDWYEHRVLKDSEPSVNVHVFSDGCEEIGRMLRFRDWLRSHDDERRLYERTKRDLAQREWAYVQDYADAKTEVIRAIVARAQASESTHVHGPEGGADRR